MNILPYKLATTNDLLTARAGLICLAEVMKAIQWTDRVDRYFPMPASNRGFKPSVFVNAVMLMLHEGGRCLDDLRHLREDVALRTVLGLSVVPESDSLGDWLRRTGQAGVRASVEVNRHLLAVALSRHSEVTLDIDATLCASHHRSAHWTYKKCRGYMPMVGHLAQTGQIVAVDFRAGNIAPNTDNRAFIHQCEAALPQGVRLSAVRIDAAGYQAAILDECQERQLKFAIRVKMSVALKRLIEAQEDSQWQPLQDSQRQVIQGEWTTRLVHCMDNSRHAFGVVVQRKRLQGQCTLDLDDPMEEESIQCGAYLYRAIAVSHHSLTDSQWIHWYNQRGEHSENRIKEFKSDLAAGRLPCQDFNANACYFSLCALAYNLLTLLRLHLPVGFESARVTSLRWRLYALSAKVVRHGRTLYVKLSTSHRALLAHVLASLRHIIHPQLQSP